MKKMSGSSFPFIVARTSDNQPIFSNWRHLWGDSNVWIICTFLGQLKQRIIRHFLVLPNFFRAIYSSLIVVVFLGLPLFVVLLLYVLCKLCGPLICHHCNIKLWRLSISFCSIIFGFPKLIVCVEESQKPWHIENTKKIPPQNFLKKCSECGFS